jgi:hypothetical protein
MSSEMELVKMKMAAMNVDVESVVEKVAAFADAPAVDAVAPVKQGVWTRRVTKLVCVIGAVLTLLAVVDMLQFVFSPPTVKVRRTQLSLGLEPMVNMEVEIVSPTSFFGVSLSKSSCAVEYLTMAEEDDGSVAKRRSLGTVHFSDVALDTGYTLFTTDTQVKNVTLRVSDASLSEMMATVRNEADQFSAQFKGSTTTSGSYLVTSCNTVAGLGYFSYPLKLSMHNDLSSARTPLVDASKSIWKSVSEARPASVWRSISRSLNKQSDDDSDSSNKLPKLFRSNKKTLRKLYHDMKTAYTNNLLNVLGQVLIEFPEFAFEFVNNGNASDLADVVSYFTASGGMVDLSDPHFDPKGELLCHGIASFAGERRLSSSHKITMDDVSPCNISDVLSTFLHDVRSGANVAFNVLVTGADNVVSFPISRIQTGIDTATGLGDHHIVHRQLASHDDDYDDDDWSSSSDLSWVSAHIIPADWHLATHVTKVGDDKCYDVTSSMGSVNNTLNVCHQKLSHGNSYAFTLTHVDSETTTIDGLLAGSRGDGWHNVTFNAAGNNGAAVDITLTSSGSQVAVVYASGYNGDVALSMTLDAAKEKTSTGHNYWFAFNDASSGGISVNGGIEDGKVDGTRSTLWHLTTSTGLFINFYTQKTSDFKQFSAVYNSGWNSNTAVTVSVSMDTESDGGSYEFVVHDWLDSVVVSGGVSDTLRSDYHGAVVYLNVSDVFYYRQAVALGPGYFQQNITLDVQASKSDDDWQSYKGDDYDDQWSSDDMWRQKELTSLNVYHKIGWTTASDSLLVYNNLAFYTTFLNSTFNFGMVSESSLWALSEPVDQWSLSSSLNLLEYAEWHPIYGLTMSGSLLVENEDSVFNATMPANTVILTVADEEVYEGTSSMQFVFPSSSDGVGLIDVKLDDSFSNAVPDPFPGSPTHAPTQYYPFSERIAYLSGETLEFTDEGQGAVWTVDFFNGVTMTYASTGAVGFSFTGDFTCGSDYWGNDHRCSYSAYSNTYNYSTNMWAYSSVYFTAYLGCGKVGTARSYVYGGEPYCYYNYYGGGYCSSYQNAYVYLHHPEICAAVRAGGPPTVRPTVGPSSSVHSNQLALADHESTATAQFGVAAKTTHRPTAKPTKWRAPTRKPTRRPTAMPTVRDLTDDAVGSLTMHTRLSWEPYSNGRLVEFHSDLSTDDVSRYDVDSEFMFADKVFNMTVESSSGFHYNIHGEYAATRVFRRFFARFADTMNSFLFGVPEHRVAWPTTAPTSAPTNGYFGVDYSSSTALTAANFRCFKNSGYSFFLQRGYATWKTKKGVKNVVDPNMCHHLQLAHQAGLSTKGVVTAAKPGHGLSASIAVTALKAAINKGCPGYINIPVYLSISANDQAYYGWTKDYSKNRKWVTSFLDRCKKEFSQCGIYSSRDVWETIFGDVDFSKTSAFTNVDLWYEGTETYSFSDFYSGASSFGKWYGPTLKHLEDATICNNVEVGIDWY